MAFKELSRTEVDELLSAERVVRIGFEANGERYLVPLGFIWHRGALYAMTTHGRKTRMAAVNPSVSFQIDTSARTGLFSWYSVSGEGTFEIVMVPRKSRRFRRSWFRGFPICRTGCRPSMRRGKSEVKLFSSVFLRRR